MSCSKCRHSDVALEVFRAQAENIAWQLWFLFLYNDGYVPETYDHRRALHHVAVLSDWARREYVARGVDSQVTREVRAGMKMYDLDNNRPPAVEPSLAGIITAAQSVAHLMRGEQCECRREVNDLEFFDLFPWSLPWDAQSDEGPEVDAYMSAAGAAAKCPGWQDGDSCELCQGGSGPLCERCEREQLEDSWLSHAELGDEYDPGEMVYI